MSTTSEDKARAALAEIVWKDPERVGGALCFRGTRVSVQTLADYLKAGHSLDHFLEGFPTVEHAQAQRFLDVAVRLADEAAALEEDLVAGGRQPA